MQSYHNYTIYRADNQRRVAFFFPSGFTRASQYAIVIKKLRKIGVTVVAIDINWEKAIEELSSRGYGLLAESITDSVKSVANILKADSVTLLGASAGSFFSMHAARTLNIVSGVVLFQPWGSMSHLFWRYRRLAGQKIRWIKQGIDTEAKLEELTAKITPAFNLESLKNLDLIVFTSTSDRVITDSNEMQETLKSKLPSGTYYQSRLGHLFGIIFSMLSMRKWVSIFKL